jgi:hypothetical protein
MRSAFRVYGLVALCLAALSIPSRAGSVLGDDFNEDEDHDYNGMPSYRGVLETGYSQWMYNPDSLYKSYERYLNTLETGWDFSAQVAWFPWAKGGIGFDWIWFLSKAERNQVQVDTVGHMYDFRDRVSIVYYGPTFLSRLQFGRFGLLVGAFGAGYLDYTHIRYTNGKRSVVDAQTWALVPEVGWEYSFYRLVSFGINARAVIADIGSYSFNGKKVRLDQPDDPTHWYFIGLTRFELNGGIRFGL